MIYLLIRFKVFSTIKTQFSNYEKNTLTDLKKLLIGKKQ